MSKPLPIAVSGALLGPDYATSGPVTLHLSGGVIADITPLTGTNVPAVLAVPAFADAHNHARPLSTTSFGLAMKPLESWLPGLAIMPAVDPYDAAAASFARSLRGGCTAVMVHLTRAMGGMSFVDEARQIARAASDVGISIGFAIAMRDRNPLIYGDHTGVLEKLDADHRALAASTWLAPLPSIEAQLAQVDAVATALADLPHVDVQYGPTGVQWCSNALLQAIADASAATGRRIHMHLLETKPQRNWADQAYPQGIATMLQDIGFLSPRVTLAHCVWANDGDLAVISASGARIAVNASSNLHLASGIAPVARMLAAGVEVAMGLDGCALDEDDDALREMRLLRMLNGGWGYEPSDLTPARCLRAVCATGRKGLGLDSGGVLAVGRPADLMLLDLTTLDRDAILAIDPRDYLFSRARKEDILQVYARGRLVMDKGVVLGVDLAATEARLRAAYRAGMSEKASLIAAWPAIEAAIGQHYKGCC